LTFSHSLQDVSLNEHNLRLEVLLDALYADVMIADANGVIHYVSNYSAQLYGLPKDSFLGRSVNELEKSGVFTPSATRLVLESGQRVSIVQHVSDDVKVLVTAVPIFDEAQRLLRVVSYTHNLNDLIHFKENLAALQRDMDRVHGELELLRQREMNHIIPGSGFPHTIINQRMRAFLDALARVAATDVTVLLLGETGVGKSMYARHAHQLSARSTGPFIELNCATIPEALFESELFGYQPGAFTGASKTGRMGMFELANGGTIFLDEVGEIPLSMQAKLLKVIQEKSFVRVGGLSETKSDFRLLAATNRDLKKLVDDGQFREDLYFRLNVVPLHVPPLRLRKEDIARLVREFVEKFNARYHRDVQFSQPVYLCLEGYSWPGNVRELEHFVERMIVTSESALVDEDALPWEFRQRDMKIPYARDDKRATSMSLKSMLAQYEKQLLAETRRTGLSTTQIAKKFGMSQATVVRKLQKYGITHE